MGHGRAPPQGQPRHHRQDHLLPWILLRCPPHSAKQTNTGTALTPLPGQASSHAGFIYYSGGATLAVNNTYKPADPGPLHKYEYVSFTKVMRLDPNTEDWSQVRYVSN